MTIKNIKTEKIRINHKKAIINILKNYDNLFSYNYNDKENIFYLNILDKDYKVYKKFYFIFTDKETYKKFIYNDLKDIII